MAKENSLNIGLYDSDPAVNDKLAEVLDGVIENVQTSAISEQIKAKNGSGTPESGSVEYKRFANAELKDKGTARTAGTGEKVKAKPVIVNIDTDKEIVEELQKKDIKLYGVAGLAERRALNHAKRIKAFLDRQFFSCAVTAGTSITRDVGADTQAIVDKLILTAKTLNNDFIDGLDASDLVLILSSSYRKLLKNVLDDLPNGTDPKTAAIGMYDSVITYESTRLPDGVNAIVMMDGAVAQPFYVSEYDAEKIPLDDAIALESFLYKGTKALMEDTIFYDEDEESV